MHLLFPATSNFRKKFGKWPMCLNFGLRPSPKFMQATTCNIATSDMINVLGKRNCK